MLYYAIHLKYVQNIMFFNLGKKKKIRKFTTITFLNKKGIRKFTTITFLNKKGQCHENIGSSLAKREMLYSRLNPNYNRFVK